MKNNIDIINYTSVFKNKYKKLNYEWINKYFHINDIDEEILSNPEIIIENDGYIFCAFYNNQMVGTCNLEKIDDSNYEISKLCVTELAQGNGIREMLLDNAIKKAIELETKKIYLFTNSILIAAYNLYEKKRILSN